MEKALAGDRIEKRYLPPKNIGANFDRVAPFHPRNVIRNLICVFWHKIIAIITRVGKLAAAVPDQRSSTQQRVGVRIGNAQILRQWNRSERRLIAQEGANITQAQFVNHAWSETMRFTEHGTAWMLELVTRSITRWQGRHLRGRKIDILSVAVTSERLVFLAQDVVQARVEVVVFLNLDTMCLVVVLQTR